MTRFHKLKLRWSPCSSFILDPKQAILQYYISCTNQLVNNPWLFAYILFLPLVISGYYPKIFREDLLTNQYIHITRQILMHIQVHILLGCFACYLNSLYSLVTLVKSREGFVNSLFRFRFKFRCLIIVYHFLKDQKVKLHNLK